MSEPTTLRDAIASALDDEPLDNAPAAASAPEPAAGGAGEPAIDAQAAAEIPVGDEPAAADLDALAEGDDQQQDLQQRPRDEKGKFAKTDGITPGPKSGPRQQAERPPASWKPEVREHWNALPETVRAEIARREVEVQRTLQETAEARRTAESVMKTIAPYEAFIKAENSNPLQAIDNLFSTAARLRTGTAPELAQMMAGLVQQFGIGRFGNNFIEQLDAALAGQPARQAAGAAPEIQQVIQQQLAPVQQFMTQFQQMQAQQQARVQEQAASEVESFLSKAEFGNDVREDMADILEAAQRRGQNLTLQEAYSKAVRMNDQIMKVLAQRQKVQGAQLGSQAAQRARQAAVSVSGGAPVGALRQDPTDVRSAIEAAIQMSSR